MQLSRSASRFSFDNTQQIALPALFTVFGLVMGSWAGRIPALAELHHLSHSALSMVLLCGGLGAVLSYPLSSWMMASFGGRRTSFFAGMALLGVLLAIGNAPSVSMLMLAVLSLGVTASTLDVGVNSLAAEREKQTGKSEMALLHGLGCAGGLAGALLGSLMAGMHIAPGKHFIMIVMPLAMLLWLASHSLDEGAAARKVERKSFSLPRGPLLFLGVLGFLGSMSEGSIADWGGVFLKQHFHVTDGFAPLSLSAFSVMMLLARLAGDRMKDGFGARRLVSGGALLSAAGLFFAVCAPNAWLALAGFAAAGLGLALLFPFVFSAAGIHGPVQLAGVATLAYAGSLMGPPVLGAIARYAGMQMAIGFVGTLSLVIAMVAAKSSMLK